MMNATEAEKASRELKYPRGRNREEAAQFVEAHNKRVKEIVSAFREGLEEQYASHLSSSEKEALWVEARETATVPTWVATEEAYRKLAEKR